MKKCVSIINPKDIAKANKTKADILELRTDLYKNYDLEKLVNRCKKPSIVKISGRRKPGFSSSQKAPGFTENYFQLLQHAIDLNVDYVDLDYKDIVGAKYFFAHKNKKTKIIVSYHNFQKTPDFKFLDNLVKKGINKIATQINRVEDNLVIAKLLEKYKNKIIAIGMGELGVMTRLDKRNMISYFALSKNKNSAPGQLTINQVGMRLYGIIGNPAKHSLSPKLHNPVFKKKKINARYQIWEATDLGKMMQIFRSFNLNGASVTVPYKEKVTKYLDVISKDAKSIGAVNTIVKRGKKLYGYNTDWYGIVKCFKKIKSKRIVILGRGGAAKAAKYGLEKYGARVKILHRGNIKNFNEKFDILINATPVHDKLLIDKKLINKNTVIMDMIYYKKTKLLQVGKQKKASCFNGLNMLKLQGYKQFSLWTKQNFPKK